MINIKDRHYVDIASFHVKCPNVRTHAHLQTVVKWTFSESTFDGLAWVQY